MADKETATPTSAGTTWHERLRPTRAPLAISAESFDGVLLIERPDFFQLHRDDVLKVDHELMLVTESLRPVGERHYAVEVVRAWGGTRAVSHLAATTVELIGVLPHV
jgi:hypothetical protein